MVESLTGTTDMEPNIEAARAPDNAFHSATILVVDDEASILSSMRRLFRDCGARLATALDGNEALAYLEREGPVDLVISDMRMPGMNGARLLAAIRDNWPETIRILLTGYADIGSTIDAINKGEIHRYIAKPWEDEDLLLVVRQALERRNLEREKMALTTLTFEQNAALQKLNQELTELNRTLDAKVHEKTLDLQSAMQQLQQAHEDLGQAHGELKSNFVKSIQMFSNLIEMRDGLAGHSRRVAELARRIAQAMGMAEAERQDVFVAALLHDIGLISLPDRLIGRPIGGLNQDDRALVVKHTVNGQALLMSLESLQEAARLIRSHHERFDGMGYPDGLSGMQIPLGARILALANDFDELQLGLIESRRLSPKAAAEFIIASKGKRYDPAVVDTFLKLNGEQPEKTSREVILSVALDRLEPGMVLARDLISADGVLLLARGVRLEPRLIEQLRAYARSLNKALTAHVQAQRMGS